MLVGNGSDFEKCWNRLLNIQPWRPCEETPFWMWPQQCEYKQAHTCETTFEWNILKTFSNTWFRLIVQTAMTEYLKTEKVPVSVHLPLVEPPTIPYRQRKAEVRKPAEGCPGPARSCSPLSDTCQKFTSTISCILGSYYCLVLLRYCIAFAIDSRRTPFCQNPSIPFHDW